VTHRYRQENQQVRDHDLQLVGTSQLYGAVTGVLKGTFSKPMPDGKGGTIAPTGKAFAIDMVTVGIWNRQGTMDEEFFFWDNQTFYSKMGLG